MIYVLGIGPGSIGLRTLKVDEILEKADILIAAKRNLEDIENNTAKRFYIDADLEKMKKYILENINKEIAVIASGDPSLYGIGKYILRELSDYAEIEIIPAISSVQYAFSAFKVDMNDVFITSSHGRDADFDFIFKHNKVAMLTDSKIGPREIAQKIIEEGKDYTMYVGENLSYENEILTVATPEEILKKDKYSMSVVILKKNNK
ncbi:precorrin-6Y C5,15-methyltransferase (decarboxylating) [Peptostreptococcus russellii]|uniref:Precorrin-6Y C5,15-methyltransferase (Decarboxylating) n=1 Tax=Peptostreptococcus russellii TaxID=215200 RepID=A0A1H8GYA6_9FIRM|nr:precorrin-6y C5,15-methyltransferase (decarboxylating) subunit CbiE [Peptostreptococcus russellii]SEN48228.1 precorrin-6Y C5,15-methyltransferase (decarboxylating) [Peptostreptococcus russellii]